MLPILLMAAAALFQTPTPPSDPFTPLAVYNGTWKITAQHPWSGGPAGTTDTLASHCTHHTAYFSCEQIVNGKSAMLIVYVPGEKPGQFHTKNIYPSGLSSNRGDMTISSDHPGQWTYIDNGVNDGKPTLYRTENIFKTPDHIHFEEYESTDDGKTWTQRNEGDENRLSH